MATASSSLQQQLRHAANVILYNELHGVFGELMEPSVVLSALQTYGGNSSLEGKLDDPATAAGRTALHSVTCSDTHNNNICLEIDNLSSQYEIKVRWMDPQGQNDPHNFLWTIAPCSSWVQWTQAGHLMILTAVRVNGNAAKEEHILGAYRPWMRLPSGSPHSILVQEQQQQPLEEEYSFFVETVVTDATHQDAILVAAAALDPVEFGGDTISKTLTHLHTILNNIVQHPEEDKYRRLRLANPKIQHYITSSWGAQHLLYIIGFREETIHETNNNNNDNTDDNHQEPERYLILPTSTATATATATATMQQALKWLEVLQHRASKRFVAELADPVPWQRPVVVSAGGSNSHAFRMGQGTHFVTPDERWARTERFNANRASGRGRRPERGDAPSSRGNWGR